MDINEKPVEPIRVHSEKELVRDFEKVASVLNPEKDWSIRIAAMKRIEALVYGGWYLSPMSYINISTIYIWCCQ
jgi:CLIP-associating protein 1/2